MTTIDNNTAKTYINGMLAAAFGITVYNAVLKEWQIDAVKKCASILKESEIDHSQCSSEQKQKMKEQWKLELDAYTQGFKDELRREGRLV